MACAFKRKSSKHACEIKKRRGRIHVLFPSLSIPQIPGATCSLSHQAIIYYRPPPYADRAFYSISFIACPSFSNVSLFFRQCILFRTLLLREKRIRWGLSPEEIDVPPPPFISRHVNKHSADVFMDPRKRFVLQTRIHISSLEQ